MRPFTDVLRDHRGGKLVEQLTERFGKVLEAVEDTGKPGSITVTLKVSPSKGDEDVMEVVPSIKSVVPEPDLPKALFYSDGEGSLLRDPPRGGRLFDAGEIEGDRDERAERRRRSGTD
jgi:hypothetical protein